MPFIKVYPSSQLPDRGVSETEFNIWTEELEFYLSQDRNFSIFLPGEPYEMWDSQENYPVRLSQLKGAKLDLITIRDTDEDIVLKRRQKDLRTVLSNTMVRHSTGIKWIYSMLRSDYDIQQKNIHFFSLFMG